MLWYNENKATDIFKDISRGMTGWSKYEPEELVHDYQRLVEEVLYGRSFFTTAGGRMGLAPPGARKNDTVIFFAGGAFPFVVRLEERPGSRNCNIIGDCFLEGYDAVALQGPAADFETFAVW
jgi:hypothetical protein